MVVNAKNNKSSSSSSSSSSLQRALSPCQRFQAWTERGSAHAPLDVSERYITDAYAALLCLQKKKTKEFESDPPPPTIATLSSTGRTNEKAISSTSTNTSRSSTASTSTGSTTATTVVVSDVDAAAVEILSFVSQRVSPGSGWFALWLSADCLVTSASQLHVSDVTMHFAKHHRLQYCFSVRFRVDPTTSSSSSSSLFQRISFYQIQPRSSSSSSSSSSMSRSRSRSLRNQRNIQPAIDLLCYVLAAHPGLLHLIWERDARRIELLEPQQQAQEPPQPQQRHALPVHPRDDTVGGVPDASSTTTAAAAAAMTPGSYFPLGLDALRALVRPELSRIDHHHQHHPRRRKLILDFDTVPLSADHWRVIARNTSSEMVQLVFGSTHDWQAGGYELVKAYRDNQGPARLWLDNVGGSGTPATTTTSTTTTTTAPTPNGQEDTAWTQFLATLADPQLTCLKELTVTGNDDPVRCLFQALHTNQSLQTLDLSYMPAGVSSASPPSPPPPPLLFNNNEDSSVQSLLHAITGHPTLRTLHLGSLLQGAFLPSNHNHPRMAHALAALPRASPVLYQITYDESTPTTQSDSSSSLFYQNTLLPLLEVNRFRRECAMIQHSPPHPHTHHSHVQPQQLFADALLECDLVRTNVSCATLLLMENADLLVQLILQPQQHSPRSPPAASNN